MTASSVTGAGGGESGKLTTKELSLLANGPSIYAAGVIAAEETISSPPTTGNTVTLPTPLPGGADSYVVMLTPLNGGLVYVTDMNESDGNFLGFDFFSDDECDVMYLVVKKGYRPNV